MELFYSRDISTGSTVLDAEESNHCVRVLRHRNGEVIHVVDGCGCLYRCEIVDANPRALEFRILERQEGYGSHPYHLQMAVAPPKNIDRFEWFAEKATEIGVDVITPLFGEYSERKVFNPSRTERILVSAAKQSHKGAIPVLESAVRVCDFLAAHAADDALRCICYCDETASLGVEKRPLTEVLREAFPNGAGAASPGSAPAGFADVASAPAGAALAGADPADPDVASSDLAGRSVILMIGPEGDFSRSEIARAVATGWQPVSLGSSRLRIETAALAATAAVYFALGS